MSAATERSDQVLASRLHGPEDLRLDAVPDAVAGEGEVRVKVAHNGICGTDLHLYSLGSGRADPITLGHEFSGIVDSIGPGVSGIAAGTPVAVRPLLSCGQCDRCRRGLAHLCMPPRILGCGVAEGGGLAQYCVARADMVFPLPDGVSLEQGALVEPLAVAYQGVLRGQVEPGMRVVVFGAGPIGIGVLLTLHALDIDDVVVVEPWPSRRATAGALGAARVLDPGDDDVVGEVRTRTGGRGADVVFECAGASASYGQALAVAGARARVVILGIHEEPVEWSPVSLMLSEIELRGSMAYQAGVYESVLDLLAKGGYPLAGWVEHVPWSGIVDEGFTRLRRGERMKVLVDIEQT